MSESKPIKMTRSQFHQLYKKQLEELREECNRMVSDGECDQEYADFRFCMVQDEILWCMEDDIVIVDD